MPTNWPAAYARAMSVHSDGLWNLSCGLDSEIPASASSETPQRTGQDLIFSGKRIENGNIWCERPPDWGAVYLLLDNTFSTASITVPFPLYKQYLLIFSALSFNRSTSMIVLFRLPL